MDLRLLGLSLAGRPLASFAVLSICFAVLSSARGSVESSTPARPEPRSAAIYGLPFADAMQLQRLMADEADSNPEVRALDDEIARLVSKREALLVEAVSVKHPAHADALKKFIATRLEEAKRRSKLEAETRRRAAETPHSPIPERK